MCKGIGRMVLTTTSKAACAFTRVCACAWAWACSSHHSYKSCLHRQRYKGKVDHLPRTSDKAATHPLSTIRPARQSTSRIACAACRSREPDLDARDGLHTMTYRTIPSADIRMYTHPQGSESICAYGHMCTCTWIGVQTSNAMPHAL